MGLQKGTMMKKFWLRKSSVLDEPITKALTDMKTYDLDTIEYRAAIEHLEQLMKMKTEERRNRVSADTIAIIAGNVMVALIIVGYERGHVMTSKTMSFVLRPKD
jgi:hypothetical protein